MVHEKDAQQQGPENPGIRFYFGLTIFVISFFMLPIGLVIKGQFDSHFMKVAVVAAFWISAPLMKFSSIAIMGKASYVWLNYHIRHLFHMIAPPHQITPIRYNIGLVMFILPFVPNYVVSFVPYALPDSEFLRYAIVLVADIMFIFSLFVLGGDFWDKLRALFIYTAKAKFEEQ
jgi:hypothetical protein